MKSKVMIALLMLAACHCHARIDTVDIFEFYMNGGYKSSLGYLGWKAGYLPPVLDGHLQLTTGLGFTVFQQKSSVGANIFFTNNRKRPILHIGGDYALAWWGNITMDSGEVVRFNTNHYICPYAGIKFMLPDGPYMNIQIGYNFLLTPQPNLRIPNPSRLSESDYDYLNGYVQRRVDGGFMVMVSFSGDFCRRYRKLHEK